MSLTLVSSRWFNQWLIGGRGTMTTPYPDIFWPCTSWNKMFAIQQQRRSLMSFQQCKDGHIHSHWCLASQHWMLQGISTSMTVWMRLWRGTWHSPLLSLVQHFELMGILIDRLSYKSWQWLEKENRLVAMAIGTAMAESQLILGETGLGIRCGRWIFGLHWVFSLTCWLPWAGIRVKRDSNFVISPAETVWEWLRMYPSTIFHHILQNPKKSTKWWISQEFDVASPHSCASAIQTLPLVATHTDC